MKLLAVTFGTNHGLLRPVDVGRVAFVFTQVFGSDARAVAGGAVVLHGRNSAEFMTRYQSAVEFVRSADMTLSAGSVTLLAMISERFIERRTFAYVSTPGGHGSPESFEGGVKAHRVSMVDICVTGIAARFGRVGDEAEVRAVFVFNSAVAAMTDYTADFAMRVFHEIGVFHKDLFPHLQRRQVASSALSRSFFGGLLFHDGGYFLEQVFIGMTVNAGTDDSTVFEGNSCRFCFTASYDRE
jgi:hypothetical protein